MGQGTRPARSPDRVSCCLAVFSILAQRLAPLDVARDRASTTGLSMKVGPEGGGSNIHLPNPRNRGYNRETCELGVRDGRCEASDGAGDWDCPVRIRLADVGVGTGANTDSRRNARDGGNGTMLDRRPTAS